MSDFKAEMHQIVCRLGLCPRPCVYSVHFVYLYVLFNWPLAPLLQIHSYHHSEQSAHGTVGLPPFILPNPGRVSAIPSVPPSPFWPTVVLVEPLARCVVCLSVAVCLSSLVCDVLYCGKTVRPSQKTV